MLSGNWALIGSFNTGTALIVSFHTGMLLIGSFYIGTFLIDSFHTETILIGSFHTSRKSSNCLFSQRDRPNLVLPFAWDDRDSTFSVPLSGLGMTGIRLSLCLCLDLG